MVISIAPPALGTLSCREFEGVGSILWVGMNGTSASFLPGETRLGLPLQEL